MAENAESAETSIVTPLVEHAEGAILPGVVSIRRSQTCNDAAILSRSPLAVRMPAQQWSYGLLIPISADAIPKNINALTVKFELSIQEGDLGIAGVDEHLSKLTTVERFLGSGKATVSLPIFDIAKTRAIVLRTASARSPGPKVTLLDASAHIPAALRLTARRHDLPFDLVVICASGKTASQTVEQTILAVHPWAQVRRLHFISDESIARVRMNAAVAPPASAHSLFAQINEARRVRREIKITRDLGGSVGIITGVREPIDRSIASIFQSLPDTLPSYSTLHAAGPKFVGLLQEVVIQAWQAAAKKNFSPEFIHPFWGTLSAMNVFFKDEFLPLTGIDILRHSIDTDAGFTVLSGGKMPVLFYRFEDIARGLASGLSTFLGCPNLRMKNENLADGKAYAELYREFRKTFKVPRELCETIYNNMPYARHIYSESEIAQFRARWSE
jgi:hypothetical protein